MNTLLDIVKEIGVVQIIDSMTKQMTEEELYNQLNKYVEEYKDSCCIEDDEDVVNTVDFWRHTSTKDLCDDFLRFFQNKLCWELISSCNNSLIIDTIEEFEDKIDFGELVQNNCLNIEILKQYQEKLNIENISTKAMGEDFIIENQDKYDFHWSSISDNCHNFSNNFFSKCKDKLYWWRISRWNKNINEDFIRTFHNKVDWIDIIQYQEVSDELLSEYKDFIKTEPFLKNYSIENTREEYCYNRLSKIFDF